MDGRGRPEYTTHRAVSRRSTRLVVVGLLVAAVVGIAALALITINPWAETASERADKFAAAWAKGDDEAAARMSDRPDVAAAALTASRKGLDGAKLTAKVAEVTERDDRATARLELEWDVPEIGPFAYTTAVPLEQGDDVWKIVWRPELVHPKLTDDTRLGTSVSTPARGAILDRAGRPLVSERSVTDVAVKVDDVEDPQATATALAGLVDVDADSLATRIEDAPDGRFLPVVTLRDAEYQRVKQALEDVRGVSVNSRTAPLAPTKGFARAVLGVVGAAIAEQVEKSEGALKAGDEVGQFGLQARFEERLRGTPTRTVVTRNVDGGEIRATLKTRKGREGRALRTTLDRRAQTAAEAALGASQRKAALVALQPSTGDVLAVANRPTSSAYNRAFEGLYPPGSTFKVVSTAALLADGLEVDDVVECPARRTVGGRSFKNFEGGAAGAVPFRVDFAQSCNTAFVSLAEDLDAGRIVAAAKDFGFGAAPKVGLNVGRSAVPEATDLVSRAAQMIGQDRIVASPLTMAGVAGTVAAGRWRAPRLVSTSPRDDGPPLPAGDAATLRELMRQVVTTGTGTALASVPGEVHGKSGTAEYGGGDPPPTHAWFIAYRDDVAVAVLVEGGRAGGEVAAPIAARFFTSLAPATAG
jgi:cell division protein FtsI/penicillin-binding protein 2